MQHVVIDRSLSTVPLFTGAFADDPEGGGYGLLEQWVPRVGNYTSRRGSADALTGDALVVICPTLLPSPRFRDELIDWVQSGGRLMVFDTPDVEDSTANSLLMLFGLTSVHNAVEQKNEPLRLADRSRETPLQASCEIRGGEPLALWGQVPIAARTRFGEGWVTAIGFGSLFNDASMGYHWLRGPGRGAAAALRDPVRVAPCRLAESVAVLRRCVVVIAASLAGQSPHGREAFVFFGEHFDGTRQEDHGRSVVRVFGQQVAQDACGRVKLRLFISGQRGFVARLQVRPSLVRGGTQFIQIDRFGNVDNLHTAQAARGELVAKLLGGGAGNHQRRPDEFRRTLHAAGEVHRIAQAVRT